VNNIKIILIIFNLLLSTLTLFAGEHYSATKNLNVRSGPGTKYAVSFSIRKGEQVEYLSRSGDWYEILYERQQGYVYSKYLQLAESSDLSQNTSSDSTNSTRMTLWILVLIGWMLPLLLIISSTKTSGGEKAAWILAVLFISWFSWIFYLLLAPIKKRD